MMKPLARELPINGTAKRQLLLHCLPILGTSLVLCWLSREVPPTTWRLFLQMCLQWPVLWAEQGTSLLLPFSILLLQSLLLGVSWILIIRLVLREGNNLLRLLFQGRQAAVVSDTYQPPAPQQGQLQQALPLQQKSGLAPSPQQEYWLPDGIVPKEQRSDEREYSFRSRQPTSLEEALGNPFNEALPVVMPQNVVAATPQQTGQTLDQEKQERSRFADSEPILPPAYEADKKEEQIAAQTTLEKKPALRNQRKFKLLPAPTPQQREETSDPPERTVREASPEEAPENAQHSSEEEQQMTPDGNFPALLHQLGFVLQPQINSAPPTDEQQEQPQEKQQPGNPFDVKQEVLDIFTTANRSKDELEKHHQQDDALKALVQKDMADGEFVYGHPFDGPLPEVFRHDEVLRRSVMEQIVEEVEQNPSKGEKKPTRRTPRKKD
jgi:hypothetical protein